MENFWAKLKVTGEVVNVKDVPRGNACGCVCIKCGGELQSRQGEFRMWHFKHLSGIECNPETILHILAKEILIKHQYIILPDGKGRFEYNGVLAEKTLIDHRPDIILEGSQENISIEIAVTSFIKARKYLKIVKADLNTIEIDLSKLSRDSQFRDLEKIIIDEVSRKEIIHWKKNPAKEDKNSNLILWLIPILVFLAGWVYYKRRRIKMRRKRNS